MYSITIITVLVLLVYAAKPYTYHSNTATSNTNSTNSNTEFLITICRISNIIDIIIINCSIKTSIIFLIDEYLQHKSFKATELTCYPF